jgi:hypothetical protein
MEKLSRRLFVKSIVVSAFGFTSCLAAEEKPEMIIRNLTNALRSINNSVCEKAADNLLLLKNNKSNYDLHLRNAKLNHNGIKVILEAIKVVHDENGPSLRSFSMSYNSNLRDEGVLILVKALPSTVTEIGLVGCGFGDKGAEALMTWVPNAPKLHWLCIEQNDFSKNIKNRLMTLAKERAGLLVVT